MPAAEPAQAVLYLCGPGLDWNRSEFAAHAVRLRRAGFAVASPARLDPADLRGQPAEPSAADWQRAALRLLLESDGVALLPGWRDSPAALFERDVAGRLDIPALPVPAWLTAAGQNAYRLGVVPDYDLTVLDEVRGRF